MKANIVISILSAIFLSSCSEDDLNSGIAGKTFNHLLVESEQECLDARSSGFLFNCHQMVEFTDGKSARVMLTDIMNLANYTVRNRTIVITPAPLSEFSSDIVFDFIDESTLQRRDNGTIWKERVGDSLWD